MCWRPGNTRNTRLIIERCHTGCWSLDGGAGPNLACDSCGARVATRIDDCNRWLEVRLEPAAVTVGTTSGPVAEGTDPFPWETAEEERLGVTPAYEPNAELPDWLWFDTLTSCAARILAAADGGPLDRLPGPQSPWLSGLIQELRGLRSW
ncbi:hypothetical protein GCM10029978_034980 [Actinoallomurus acanthiterrae]